MDHRIIKTSLCMTLIATQIITYGMQKYESLKEDSPVFEQDEKQLTPSAEPTHLTQINPPEELKQAPVPPQPSPETSHALSIQPLEQRERTRSSSSDDCCNARAADTGQAQFNKCVFSTLAIAFGISAIGSGCCGCCD